MAIINQTSIDSSYILINIRTPSDGSNGNVGSFTVDDITVDVSGFSRNKSLGNWNQAYVGVYAGGLGITNTHESTHAHQVDNSGSVNYLVFEFDTDVAVDKALLKYIHIQS